MKKLSPCGSCRGFLPAAAATCPHCAAPVAGSRFASLAKKAFVAASASSVAVTLMACYGPPPRDYHKVNDPEGQQDPRPRAVDADAGPTRPSMPAAK